MVWELPPLLKKYTPGSVAPKQYDSEDIDKMRKVNTDLRALEEELGFTKNKNKFVFNVKRRIKLT